MDETLKFRATDFIPIIGVFDYQDRNICKTITNSKINKKYLPEIFMEKILVVYNVALVVGAVIGLEKLLR